jgi:ubiquinone/menaquinone biosynthesis C-methylase UbiE
MNVLYLGKYKQRFAPIIDQIKMLPENSKILELCFGDIVIADHCKKNRLEWIGMDINESFVRQAQKKDISPMLKI